MTKSMMIWILLFAGVACSVHHAVIDPSKLDPAFAALIASQKGRGTSAASHHKPRPVEGRTTPDAAPEMRYDCIVYTRQAAVLRKKGIVVRSELPDFVTAWASLKQIEQMAAMVEVTYIEAPKTNFPNRQENQLH